MFFWMVLENYHGASVVKDSRNFPASNSIIIPKQKEIRERKKNMSNIYETLKLDLSNPEIIKTLAKAIADDCNNMFFQYEEVAREIYQDDMASARFLRLAVLWVEARANDCVQKSYDGRDAVSAKIGNELFDSHYIQEELDKEDGFSAIAKSIIYGTGRNCFADHYALQRMHRTLKQTFSTLVFRYLDLLETGSVAHGTMLEQMREKYGSDWYHCPFI